MNHSPVSRRPTRRRPVSAPTAVPADHAPGPNTRRGTGGGAQTLLPAEVLALLQPRRRAVASPQEEGTGPPGGTDQAGQAAAVVHTHVEIRDYATANEIAAAGLSPLDRPPRTATDVAFRWLLSHESAATRRAYCSDLRQFAIWCRSEDVEEVLAVRRPVIEAYDRYLAAGVTHELPDGTTSVIKSALKPASRGRRLAALSSFFDYAVDEGLLAGNTVARVRRPRMHDEDRDTRSLSAAELRRLIDAAEQHGRREYALVCLLGLLGMRNVEAARVDIEHITTRLAGPDSGRGTHHALQLPRTGKGRRTRTLAIPPRAYSAITAAVDGRTSGPLLRTSSGRRISTDQIRASIKVLAKRAGVGLTTHREHGRPVIDDIWLHPHTLRHTFATLARDSGGRLEDVQDALGHADPRTTRIYDTGRGKLDRSPTYSLDALIAQQTGIDAPPDDTQDGSR